jgi:hypothetical protein
VKAVKGLSLPQQSGGRDRSAAETLDFRGATAPFLPPDTLKEDRVFLEEGMRQSPVTTYADIAVVRTVTGAGTCNQLLAEGWVLLGIVPLTMIGEMGAGQPGMESRANGSRTPNAMSGGQLGMSLAGSGSTLVSKMSLFEPRLP